MKKLFLSFFWVFLILLTLIIFTLSTVGITTERFNSFITKRINETNTNIDLKLSSVDFRLDIKQFSLFLETNNPEISFRELSIPIKNIKVYIDFISIIKTKPEIYKINFSFIDLNANSLKEISTILKPSNFASFLKNKVKSGKVNFQLELYLDNSNSFENFIARGDVIDLKANIIDDINIENTKFNFFADKSDILIKNFQSNAGPILISDADIKLELLPTLSINTNFKTKFSYQENIPIIKKFLKRFAFEKNIKKIEADLTNNLQIIFDETYKIKKYNYQNSGKILSAVLDFKNLKKEFLQEKLMKINLINTDFKINMNSNYDNFVKLSGNYFLTENRTLPISLTSNFNKDKTVIELNTDFDEFINLEFLNYKKQKNNIANIFLKLEKKKEKTKIEKFQFKDADNIISVENIKLSKNKITYVDKISVKTRKDGKINNEFLISLKDKILIRGLKYDAERLGKIFSQKKNNNYFSNISKDIEIEIKSINTPISEKISNFKLLGRIERGKFTKISSKGDYSDNKFLDITLKEEKNSKKKYLEIYSDLAKPLLSEYSFFSGLAGGKLFFTSVIDKDTSLSKLIIEDFKVVSAPAIIKLLSLADLGGLADLAEGEGLSFEVLEINMEKNNDILKISEILALGPSISVIMEGYQDESITSLRGNLVPAKTLNTLISKIPVIGDIVIPKEVGEGLFGISFKIKGPPGKLKTTINPIRTITPRFIQKIVDRKKNSK